MTMTDDETIDTGLNATITGQNDAVQDPPRGRGRPVTNPNSDWQRRKARREGRAMPEGEAKVHNLFGSEKSGPKPRAAKPKKDLEGITKSIQLAHAMIAMKTNMPELMLEDNEAQLLAESGNNLLEYYKIKVSGKTGAMIAMAYAVTIVYGPRAFAIVMKARNEAREQPQPEQTRPVYEAAE